ADVVDAGQAVQEPAQRRVIADGVGERPVAVARGAPRGNGRGHASESRRGRAARSPSSRGAAGPVGLRRTADSTPPAAWCRAAGGDECRGSEGRSVVLSLRACFCAEGELRSPLRDQVELCSRTTPTVT